MTIIEADGESTEPLTVDQIQIFPGQRYSFVLNANQNIGNYWYRPRPASTFSQPKFSFQGFELTRISETRALLAASTLRSSAIAVPLRRTLPVMT